MLLIATEEVKTRAGDTNHLKKEIQMTNNMLG